MRKTGLFLLAGAALLQATAAFAADAEYRSSFDPAPMTLATRDAVAGTGSLTARVKGNVLTIEGTFAGLASAATRAQVHSGEMAGVPGNSFADLTVTQAASGEISGHVTLNKAQAKALADGGIYVQIDSVKAPDGSLRAWLMPPP